MSDRAFRRSESTVPSASRLIDECAHPRVSAPPSSRFAVTDGNVHAQVASKWRRFWRLLTGVRRIKHDSGSDDSCDPEVFFPRMRSGDPEVGVGGDKSEVCRRPLFARVRDAMAGGLELGSPLLLLEARLGFGLEHRNLAHDTIVGFLRVDLGA
jgi:hypothetical protein